MKTVQVTLEIPGDIGIGTVVNHSAALVFAHDYMLWPHSDHRGNLLLTWVDHESAKKIASAVYPKRTGRVVYL